MMGSTTNVEGINNLFGWYQESQDEGRQELEVFLCGGIYNFKKASLDIRKI